MFATNSITGRRIRMRAFRVSAHYFVFDVHFSKVSDHIRQTYTMRAYGMIVYASLNQFN